MAGNILGKLFTLTTFGESHGAAIGGVIDGCPAGLLLDMDLIRMQLNRRKPGQSMITTERREEDEVEILSGILNGTTTGPPIGFIIRNNDQRPADYAELEKAYRPSHADFTYDTKYGIRDPRGGGRSSARETVARVFAGAIAEQFLSRSGVSIVGYVSSVGKIKLNSLPEIINRQAVDTNMVRCPDPETAEKMIQHITNLKNTGDSTGGIISCIIRDLPPGLGEPVFDKLHADLAKAMLSINAVHGFEYGSGFAGSEMTGSEHNDEFYRNPEGHIKTKTNFSGGIQGGISNGMDINFRVAFKPVATIKKDQQTVTTKGEQTVINASGRHDACVVPRAVPIVEAMTALVLADHLLRYRTSKL
jgi:chorismate synthase